ncbi:MAG TPA: SpoIIE family protein phosphatase [Bryobacteraceae bacterium]|nr:SpoIIE family protein phosphatase [Bryobacteraceae bacterium]
MSLTFRQLIERLGKTGIAFVVALALFILAYFFGRAGWAVLFGLALVPLSAILLLRGLRVLQRRGLWSVRNRLLCVYALIGVLPLLLVLALVGLGAWAVTNELAIYLATSALKERISGLEDVVEALRNLPLQEQFAAAPEMLLDQQAKDPGMRIYIEAGDSVRRFPSNSPDIQFKPGWHDVKGLAVYQGRFYGMAHLTGNGEEITAVVPLSDRMVDNLVPNLGAISLFETDGEASAGGLRSTFGSDADSRRAGPKLNFRDGSEPSATGVHLPPSAFRFDIPVLWPTYLPHYHLDKPNKSFRGVLLIYSRPSAVLKSFFSGNEFWQGVLFDFFIAIALLFLLAEFVAVLVGAHLARRLTGAINALYEGTRRVIYGDFSHRIPVRSQDQLGELGSSFNQMTSNLERLLVVEKEKERLQTELEIAREVQYQLYPKQAPPSCGLKLSVQCDPARMVSGDYYDYQELEGKRLAFAIGDVAGKGISAALLMATLQATLRSEMAQFQPEDGSDCDSQPEIDVAKLVSALNKQLCAHTSPEKYATFFFALFNEQSRTLSYTNAGHLSPLLFRGGEVVPLESNGMVVGAFPFAKYDESCLSMGPGDLLVCYTDGITEPENPYGEEFGEERLIDLVHKHSHRDDSELISIVLEAVRSWKGGPELHDDMTLLLARGVQPA